MPPRTAAVHFPQKENLPLAADGRHADAIPVVRDAAHHAGEARAVPLVLLPRYRGRGALTGLISSGTLRA